MRRLGLIGGMSWESSIEYERLINQTVRRHRGGMASADLLIRSFDFSVVENLQSSGEWEKAGRLLAEAPRDKETVLVVDIDLGLRSDWLTLFPFFGTRRPDTYGALTEAVRNPRQPSGEGQHGGIPGLDP